MKKKSLLIGISFLALLEPSIAEANLDLIVDSSKELEELYEDGVYNHQTHEHNNSAVQDSGKPETLPFQTKIQNNAIKLYTSSRKKRDPIFDNANGLKSILARKNFTDDNTQRENSINTSDIEEIVMRAGVQKKEPVIEADKLQGLAIVAQESLIDDQKVAKIFSEENAIHNKKIQIIGFNESIAAVLLKILPLMDQYIGQEISLNLLDEITALFKDEIRKSNIPFTNVYAPPQDISQGIVYLVIKPAIVDDISIAKSEHFNALRILSKIEQDLGSSVDVAKLEDNLAILSLHPDRQVKATFSPGEIDNTTRINIDVEEQKPWSVYASKSNDGSEDLDKNLIALGGYHNNLWGLDHRASYQYTMSADRKSLKAHNFEYNLPYIDTHSLVLRYTRSKTKASILDDSFESRGDFSQIGVRHKTEFIGRHALADGWSLDEQKLAIGVDQKRIDGDILFTLFGDSLDTDVGADLEVYNTVLDYEGVLNDPYKGTSKLSASFVYSPGGIGDKNDNEDFITARADTKSRYAYLRFAADRAMPLLMKFLGKPLAFKKGVQGQISADRLIGSERFVNSYRPGFRGYQSGSFSGDSGVAGYLELETSPYNLVNTKHYKDTVNASVFTDFGTFYNNDISDSEEKRSNIFSVGGSVKYQVNNNINSEIVVSQDISGQGDDLGQRFMYRLLVKDSLF